MVSFQMAQFFLEYINLPVKIALLEKSLIYELSIHSKFKFSCQKTDSQASLVFLRKATEFLSAKHWLS